MAFGLTLGVVAVAAALAFGLGGRESAGKIVESWRRSAGIARREELEQMIGGD